MRGISLSKNELSVSAGIIKEEFVEENKELVLFARFWEMMRKEFHVE